MKEKTKADTLSAKRAKKEVEIAKQKANANLRRGLRLARIMEKVATSQSEYNLQIHQSVVGRREFREEMKRKKEARRKTESAEKKGLKASLAERVHNMSDMEER